MLNTGRTACESCRFAVCFINRCPRWPSVADLDSMLSTEHFRLQTAYSVSNCVVLLLIFFRVPIISKILLIVADVYSCWCDLAAKSRGNFAPGTPINLWMLTQWFAGSTAMNQSVQRTCRIIQVIARMSMLKSNPVQAYISGVAESTDRLLVPY